MSLKEITFLESDSIKGVLKQFNKTALQTDNYGFGIIVDAKGICIGVVTDGDVRRKIVKGMSLDAPIRLATNFDFVYAYDTDTSHSILRHFDKKITILPVLDTEKRLVKILKLSDLKASLNCGDLIIRARVPVRISYAGGGTDMSYYTAHNPGAVLSSTISKYCTASVIVREDKTINILSKDLGLKYQAQSLDNIKLGDKLDLIKAAIKIMQPTFGFDIETNSDIDAGTGLGGSSALTVAVIGALNYFRNEKQNDLYEIADLSYQSERINLGISGGWQDQYSTSFGGFNWIDFRKKDVLVNPLRIRREIILELKYNLMLFRFGGSHDSGHIQLENKRNFNSRDKEKMDIFSNMMTIAIEMKESLLKGKVKNFGDLLNKSWQLKKLFGKSTNPEIDLLYAIALEEGALGGKVLGAGEAGYLIIYASPKYHKGIKDRFQHNGATLAF